MTSDENDDMYWIWGRFYKNTDDIIAELAKDKDFSSWEIYAP